MQSRHEPDSDSLRVQLRIEWDDHFRLKDESWKMLQAQAVLLVGVVGLNYQADGVGVTVAVLSGILFIGVVSASLLYRNWKVQVDIFNHISVIEGLLGLKEPAIPGLKGRTGIPRRFLDIVNLKNPRVPVQLLRLSLVMTMVGVGYVIARACN